MAENNWSWKIPGKNEKKGRSMGLLSGKYGNVNNKDGIWTVKQKG